MRTYIHKSGREFRLSAIVNESPETYGGSWFCVIYWIATEHFQTISYQQIEPYLQNKL